MRRFALVVIAGLLAAACQTPRFIPYWNEAVDKHLSTVVEEFERIRATAAVSDAAPVFTSDEQQKLLIEIKMAEQALPDDAKGDARVHVRQEIVNCANAVAGRQPGQGEAAPPALSPAAVPVILQLAEQTCREALEHNRDLK